MKIAITNTQLQELVARQLGHMFMFDPTTETDMLHLCIDAAIERCTYCFSKIDNKYYCDEGRVYFNPFHSGQYAIFLYFLSRAIYKREAEMCTLADRVYYLNKCLNGLDLFYEVEMPNVFFLDHPVGSVMGRAIYGENFSFLQNCTVGNNNGAYPRIGENVSMKSGSKIIGRCTIGNNVTIAANAYLKDVDIADNSIVFGSYPNLHIVEKPRLELAFKSAITA